MGAVGRRALPAALLGAEALALSLAVDLPVDGPAMPLVRAMRVAFPVVLGAIVAAWIVDRDRRRSATTPAMPLMPWRPAVPLALHLAAFAGTAALAWRALRPGAPPPGPAVLVAITLAAAGTAVLAAATAAPPSAILRALLSRWMLPLSALCAGGLAWWAAEAAEALWGTLSRATLGAAAALLSLGGAVAVDAASSQLRFRGFGVTIAPVCSGADGIGLVLVFQALWLVLARTRVRLGRALVLLPIGAAAAVAANVVRIAILVAVGAAGHPDAAVGAFHSKLGWLLFVLVALATVAVAERHPWLRKDAAPAAGTPGGGHAASPHAPG